MQQQEQQQYSTNWSKVIVTNRIFQFV